MGLKKASEERCDAVKQEYPELQDFFNGLKGVSALPTKEELELKWQDHAQEESSTFEEFSNLLSNIGLAKWREKEERYAFADLYVYGFEMVRTGAK